MMRNTANLVADRAQLMLGPSQRALQLAAASQLMIPDTMIPPAGRGKAKNVSK